MIYTLILKNEKRRHHILNLDIIVFHMCLHLYSGMKFICQPMKKIKKPFDLVKFLKDNLILGKFVSGANNFYLFFDNRSNEWKFGCSSYCQTIEAHFKLPDRKDREHIASVLSQNKITPQQLKDAYKELGWI